MMPLNIAKKMSKYGNILLAVIQRSLILAAIAVVIALIRSQSVQAQMLQCHLSHPAGCLFYYDLEGRPKLDYQFGPTRHSPGSLEMYLIEPPSYDSTDYLLVMHNSLSFKPYRFIPNIVTNSFHQGWGLDAVVFDSTVVVKGVQFEQSGNGSSESWFLASYNTSSLINVNMISLDRLLSLAPNSIQAEYSRRGKQYITSIYPIVMEFDAGLNQYSGIVAFSWASCAYQVTLDLLTEELLLGTNNLWPEQFDESWRCIGYNTITRVMLLRNMHTGYIAVVPLDNDGTQAYGLTILPTIPIWSSSTFWLKENPILLVGRDMYSISECASINIACVPGYSDENALVVPISGSQLGSMHAALVPFYKPPAISPINILDGSGASAD